jgi:hypothetical protein
MMKAIGQTKPAMRFARPSSRSSSQRDQPAATPTRASGVWVISISVSSLRLASAC